MLYMVGPIVIEVFPFNADKVGWENGHDFAAKDVIGARRPQEQMGVADTKLSLSGKVLPHRFGGAGTVELLKAVADSGDPQMVIKGSGQVLGWYHITSAKGTETFLDAQGNGRLIEWSAELVKADGPPGPAAILSLLSSLFE